MAQPERPGGGENKPVLKRQLELELDRLEAMIENLRIQYEQYFVDIVPLPPDKPQKEIKAFIRLLLKAPFKNSQTRFRLKTIIHRYQTYYTYWERVMKQREDGTYVKDLFKADLREHLQEELQKANSQSAKAEKGLRDLYASYENALTQVGSKPQNLNFDSFKKSIVHQAKQLKEKHGVKKLSYSVVVKDGKVVLKASTKN